MDIQKGALFQFYFILFLHFARIDGRSPIIGERDQTLSSSEKVLYCNFIYRYNHLWGNSADFEISNIGRLNYFHFFFFDRPDLSRNRIGSISKILTKYHNDILYYNKKKL